MGTMEIWYAHLAEEDILAALRARPKNKKDAKEVKRSEKNIEKARTRDSLQALSKLAERVDGTYRIVSQPPIVVPLRDLAVTYGLSPGEVEQAIHEQFRGYRASLQDDRRHLLERFQLVDLARKVVGVGSVGTRAFIVLLQGRDDQDPLFLQVKEATASVLEDHLPKSRYKQHGERVVQGQRMMQAASDIYLGWAKGADVTRYYYWRQLRDMKGSALVESMSPAGLTFYAGHLRVDAGSSACPVGRSDRHRRVPRRERRVRPFDHRLLEALRGPERARLPGVRGRHPVRKSSGPRGRLKPRETGFMEVDLEVTMPTTDDAPGTALRSTITTPPTADSGIGAHEGPVR